MQRKRIIKKPDRLAVDFDGVIHKYSNGRGDGSIYDEPNISVLIGISELIKEGYVVFIHTARHPGKVKAWLNRQYPWFGSRAAKEGVGFPVAIIPKRDIHWRKADILGITNHKLGAVAYIDDRAIHFTGSWKRVLRALAYHKKKPQ